MTAAIAIFALVDITLALWLWAEKSPVGYEDATGWHEGRP